MNSTAGTRAADCIRVRCVCIGYACIRRVYDQNPYPFQRVRPYRGSLVCLVDIVEAVVVEHVVVEDFVAVVLPLRTRDSGK